MPFENESSNEITNRTGRIARYEEEPGVFVTDIAWSDPDKCLLSEPIPGFWLFHDESTRQIAGISLEDDTLYDAYEQFAVQLFGTRFWPTLKKVDLTSSAVQDFIFEVPLDEQTTVNEAQKYVFDVILAGYQAARARLAEQEITEGETE